MHPHLQSTLHNISLRKKWHVRLGGANKMHLLSWRGTNGSAKNVRDTTKDGGVKKFHKSLAVPFDKACGFCDERDNILG